MKRSALLVALASSILSPVGCAPDPMHAVSLRGDVALAVTRLEEEPGLSLTKRREFLWIGAIRGHEEYVSFWVENGCSDEVSLGRALYFAAANGRVATARTLIDLGADPDYNTSVFGDLSTFTPLTGILYSAAGVWNAAPPQAPPGEPEDLFGALMLLHGEGADMRAVSTRDPHLVQAVRRGHGAMVAYHENASRLQTGRTREERKAAVAARGDDAAEKFARALGELEDKLSLLQSLEAARAGDASAMRTIAALYAAGERGFPKDEEEGIRWWQQAARLDDLESQAELRRRGVAW